MAEADRVKLAHAHIQDSKAEVRINREMEWNWMSAREPDGEVKANHTEANRSRWSGAKSIIEEGS